MTVLLPGRGGAYHPSGMRTVAALLALLGVFLPAGLSAGPRNEPPSLVVLVVVDQLGWDVLHHYEPAFSGGFRRLLEGGAVYTEAVYDHATTETAPGHATLATGVEPARNGIVGNDWYEGPPSDRRRVQNTEDPDVSIVGVPGEVGRSPRNLLVDGLADWLRKARPGARVVAVSRKPRAAILPAGRGHDGLVYWLSYTGRFVTSTWYRDADPAWVTRFDRDEMPGFVGDSTWALAVPDSLRGLARADDAPYENPRGSDVFPHRYADVERGGGHRAPGLWEWLADTPATDVATLAFARRAVEAEGLGRDSVPDLLVVGLSSTDAIGHDYGPYSLEQLDNLWRLDRELGDFLDSLDRTVGRGRYVVALTADHGAPPMPEYATATMAVPAVHVVGTLAARMDSTVQAAGPHARAAARALEQLPFVSKAYVLADLREGQPADSLDRFERNSQRPDRWTARYPKLGIDVRYAPYCVPSRGDTHGSVWLYDRHVPIVLYGPGHPAVRVSDRVDVVDLAPTLARDLGVAAPPDLDGRALDPPFGGRP